MKKIILVRGIQGSGKSTWSKEWVSESPISRIRINNDDMRNMCGVYWPKDINALDKRENFLKVIRKTFINEAMTNGYDIVVDNMNLNPKEWKYFRDIISKWNENNPDKEYELEFKDFFNVSLEECIERDKKRPIPVGENVICQTWKRYRTFIRAELNKTEADLVNNKEPLNANLPNAVIVDMDATLCFNTIGRPFYGEGCAEGIKDDVPNEKMKSLLASIKDTHIIILTGREGTPEIMSATQDWLKNNKVKYNQIFFREICDKTRADLCKQKIYEKNIKGKYNVIAVFDDSQKCVDMYRNNGLLTFQPNKGQF